MLWKRYAETKNMFHNLFRKVPFSVIYYQGDFDDLIHHGSWVVSKIRFANLCELIHDAIIIPVSYGPLSLENMGWKGKNIKV